MDLIYEKLFGKLVEFLDSASRIKRLTSILQEFSTIIKKIFKKIHMSNFEVVYEIKYIYILLICQIHLLRFTFYISNLRKGVFVVVWRYIAYDIRTSKGYLGHLRYVMFFSGGLFGMLLRLMLCYHCEYQIRVCVWYICMYLDSSLKIIRP